MAVAAEPDLAQRPIGVFDSGVGGLTVLRALRERLPQEHLVYLGDTARVPYGTKSPASVQRYAIHAADALVARGIKLLVVACNTASAVALPALRERLQPVPVIGVVEPGADAAVRISKTRRHLVLATEATTRQLAYTRAIHSLDLSAVVEELPCSLFVALAEEGWTAGPIVEAVAREYLGFLDNRSAADRPDTVILGCTHFPLLREPIAAVLGSTAHIIDSATTTAAAVVAALTATNALNTDSAAGSLRLVATDGAARFARLGSAFLGATFAEHDIELVDIHPTDTAAVRGAPP
ncbi:MAG: glutamate racemase [Gammaproteobacteria bacterium]|nr:glutamate racemase [Gammaproteobacteria bacterium]